MLMSPAEAKKVKLPKGTSIGFVDAANNQISLVLLRPKEGVNQATTYTMSPAAVITLDGAPVKLDRIQKGMHVSGYTEGIKGFLDSLEVEN